MSSARSIDSVVAALQADRPQALERLFEFLRIPSVSTKAAHKQDCQAAAQWACDQLSEMGFDARVALTPGHPMVVAHAGPADGPHVLFYGHYDVQPADPLNLWDTPPFEPRIEAGQCIRARGAADDKGQLMTFVEACRAWISATGNLPCRITVFLEGEEESGSPSLEPFLEAQREELQADIALVCDTGMIAPGRPAITTRLRGMVMQEVIITGPNKDLHSGMFGGPARNPIHVLAKIIADLHDDTGAITLPGFYEGVSPVAPEILADWQNLGYSSDSFLGPVGLSQPAGEAGYSLIEQIWARPTCDVNGIVGGYTEDGSKTVLPSKASAKFSFRLVGQQDPQAIAAAFRDHVRAGVPADCQVDFIDQGCDSAVEVDMNQPLLPAAQAALEETFGTAPVLVGCGGSIPVVGSFQRILGMESLLIGFGLDDDQIHSPNEKYDLNSFHLGAEAWARFLGKL